MASTHSPVPQTFLIYIIYILIYIAKNHVLKKDTLAKELILHLSFEVVFKTVFWLPGVVAPGAMCLAPGV